VSKTPIRIKVRNIAGDEVVALVDWLSKEAIDRLTQYFDLLIQIDRRQKNLWPSQTHHS
jgi:hypothetical protein